MRSEGGWAQVWQVAAATALHPVTAAGFAAGLVAGSLGWHRLAGFALGGALLVAAHGVRGAAGSADALAAVRFTLTDSSVVALERTAEGDVVADLVAGELCALELDAQGSVLRVERDGADAVPVVVPAGLLELSGGAEVLAELEHCEASGHPADLSFAVDADGTVTSFEVVGRNRATVAVDCT